MDKEKQKKKKDDKEKEYYLPDNEEDLSRFLEDIDKKKGKRIKIAGLTMNIVNNKWLNMLVYLCLNILTIIVSYFVFKPVSANHSSFIFVFIALFTIFDYLFKFLIYRYFQKFILYSLTTIFIVEDILAFMLACIPLLLFYDISINNFLLLVGSVLSFLIVRFIITFLLKRKRV